MFKILEIVFQDNDMYVMIVQIVSKEIVEENFKVFVGGQY